MRRKLFLALFIAMYCLAGLFRSYATPEETAARARIPFGERANNPATHFVVNLEGENAFIRQTDPENPKMTFKNTPAPAANGARKQKWSLWIWITSILRRNKT